MYTLLCSGVEDILRLRPDLKDIQRPSDNLTALQLASVRGSYYVVRHLALSVSLLEIVYCFHMMLAKVIEDKSFFENMQVKVKYHD